MLVGAVDDDDGHALWRRAQIVELRAVDRRTKFETEQRRKADSARDGFVLVVVLESDQPRLSRGRLADQPRKWRGFAVRVVWLESVQYVDFVEQPHFVGQLESTANSHSRVAIRRRNDVLIHKRSQSQKIKVGIVKRME